MEGKEKMNKAQEEAKRIVERYLRLEDETTFYWCPYLDSRLKDKEVLPHAIKCALICVEEILDSHYMYKPTLSNMHECLKMQSYYEQIKAEILKIK